MYSNGKSRIRLVPKVQSVTVGELKPGIVVECESLRGFTKVEFCIHAIEQMKIRGLTREDVLRTIREPELTDLHTQDGRFRFRRYRTEKRAIDVVFEETADRIIVVTAMIVTLRTKHRPN
jgi:hypothetical protein